MPNRWLPTLCGGGGERQCVTAVYAPLGAAAVTQVLSRLASLAVASSAPTRHDDETLTQRIRYEVQ